MDSILTSLLQMGVGGAMAAAVVWFLRHILTVVVPRMEHEHREALKEQQVTFRESFKEQQAIIREKQTVFQEALRDQQNTFKEAINEMVQRLERIDQNAASMTSRLEALDRHIKANQEHLTQVRDWLLKQMGKEGTGESPPGRR